MKNLIWLLLLLSCTPDTRPNNTVVGKSYVTEWGGEMPLGICYYWYKTNKGSTLFQDSCKFYKIGDTLNFKLK